MPYLAIVVTGVALAVALVAVALAHRGVRDDIGPSVREFAAFRTALARSDTGLGAEEG
ncbi:MAG: hypothetical protein ACRDZ1_00205 [Acidimicrobiia bacterium]|jgi:hypothetical protein